MKWKYVIVEHMGIETPIIFPERMNHSDVAQHGVVSAGFVTFIGSEKPWNTICVSNEIEVSCSGESVTLKKKSRGEDDAAIIQTMMRSSLN